MTLDTVPVVALAYVNRGRWVASCPFLCGGAHIAEGDAFLCGLCVNGGSDQPVALVWPEPAERREIERLLAPRPQVAQNWETGETIDDLAVENVQHGMFGTAA